eukprot:TRINITY_DN31217_c0_g1_i1.p1 TRINITY_DN31217_c0_g1~~TRINITY_DN31217_c0_g1_i1.p1  ORF type:complete len:137 (+),score=28.62 TRINITY_DN31217_c0_g1_i1:526-936(+)
MAELHNSCGGFLAALQNTVEARREMTRRMEKLMASVEHKEKSKGNQEDAKNAKEYYSKVEGVLQNICEALHVEAKKLDDHQIQGSGDNLDDSVKTLRAMSRAFQGTLQGRLHGIFHGQRKGRRQRSHQEVRLHRRD